jgi:hypothetical protein
MDIAIAGERNVTKEEARRNKDLNINTAHVERKNKCDTSNTRGNWNPLKIIQNIFENTCKARRERNAENSHIDYCAHKTNIAKQ